MIRTVKVSWHMDILVPTVAPGLKQHGPATRAPSLCALCLEPGPQDVLKFWGAAVPILRRDVRTIQHPSSRWESNAMQAIGIRDVCPKMVVCLPRSCSGSFFGSLSCESGKGKAMALPAATAVNGLR